MAPCLRTAFPKGSAISSRASRGQIGSLRNIVASLLISVDSIVADWNRVVQEIKEFAEIQRGYEEFVGSFQFASI
ncbi:hypothetical protein A2704_02940 [Candidatus Kaiserbacteria bacterium RIFCSPHIGHO2_01_FULL_54_36b]|uniref:Uncharacterized protein n=1 Tax=Candidatus Kaiserbacteria bacterium RIFCSPHIGHO2_01_FULL_54_36b TaxID=1798483 RepID=A0A1F6CPV3_9BACT|nr:MAG: hypothetical protein A2704_02940 [Candidatus Kaiserbacteria bacterium RIFCSPHIGHO2_01_FULL_54_36b]